MSRRWLPWGRRRSEEGYAVILVAVFVADQSIVISKIGVFNAATTGTLVFESRLNTVSTNVAGDTTAVTHTVTL